jgi:hypothetical protein
MRDERESNQGEIGGAEARSDEGPESGGGGRETQAEEAGAQAGGQDRGTLGHGENAYLLKRIAHAADGHRTNDRVRVLMQTKPPYRPLHVATGNRLPPVPKADERIYGPFVTAEPLEVITLKKKVARVTVHFEDGSTPVEVNGADALFWSMSAVEKFCYPWYASQYGVPVANLMWESFANDTEVAALCHDPRSEACDVTGGTARVVGVESLLSEALFALGR